MNVKFISVAASGFKAYASTYKGYFVHLTEAATIGEIKYPAGLYFGGEKGWEYLTNDTDVAAIEQKIKDAVNALDAKVAISSWNADTRKLTITGGVDETDGKVGRDGSVADVNVTFEKVALTGKAADVKLDGYNNSDGSDIIAGTTVQTAVENIIESIDDLSSASALVLLDKDDQPVSDMTVKPDGTTYKLRQGTSVVAQFNIEKDSFVKSGRVVYGTYDSGTDKFTESTEGNAFLHLVIGTADAAESNVYIAAKDMIKQFKSGTNLLSFDGETLNATKKLTDAVTKVEGLAVNGVNVAADGKVTITADNIAYGDINSDGASETVKAAIEDVYGKIAKLGTDAYKGVKNQNDAQYVKVGTIDSENKQSLSVQMGSFDVDLTYNEGGDKWVVTPSTNDAEGLVSASAVKAVINDNEQVTAAALNKLNTEVKALKAKDPVVTTVSGTNDPAYTNSGVNVRVAVNDNLNGNDHNYTVSATAELTWLTSLE